MQLNFLLDSEKKMYTIHKFSWQIHSNGIWVFTTLVLPFLLGFRFLKIKLWEKNTSNYNKCTSTYRRVKRMLWEPQAEEEGTP